jgi:hypothetical protein
MNKLSKIIRIVTVAPLMALFMLLILVWRDPSFFGGPLHFFLAVVFLSLFPLLAYPLQPLFGSFKDKGREGQRTLAIYFAVAGYVGGCVSAVLLRAPGDVCLIHLSYLISGTLVMLVNKGLKFRASGHACGVTGPISLMLYFGQPAGFLGVPLLALVWMSSISMKRHTDSQLTPALRSPSLHSGLLHCCV